MASLTPNLNGKPSGAAPRLSRFLVFAGTFIFALFTATPHSAQTGTAAPPGAQTKAAAARAPKVRVKTSACMIVVCPGGEARARVQLNAEGVAPGCEARYTWRATGGRIVGEGPNVVWDFSGTPPGDWFYDVILTVEARSGCGPRHAVSAPARVTVGPCPPRVNFAERQTRQAPACPSISLACPATARPGLPAAFTATLSGGTRGAVPTFDWSLSGGEIVGGQGTNSIRIDAKDFKGKAIVTAVEVGGYGRKCSAACTTELARAPEPDRSTKPLSMSVTVRNARDGRPVPHAEISFYLGENSLVARGVADEGGAFSRSGWVPGVYRVEVAAQRFAPLRSTVTLDQFSTGSVVFSLSPSAPTPTPTPSPTPETSSTPTPTPSPSPSPSTQATPQVSGAVGRAPLIASLVQGLGSPWVPLTVALLAALGAGSAALVRRRAPKAVPAKRAAAAAKESDQVHCTVFSREQVSPSDVFQVQVFVHLEDQGGDLAALAVRTGNEGANIQGSKPLSRPIERDAELIFKLTVPGLEVLEPEQSLVWQGRTEPPQCVEFPVLVPDDCKPRNTIGIVQIYCENAPVGRITFNISVVERGAARPAPAEASPAPPQRQIWYKRAFISYCSKDRDKVARGVQGLKRGLKWAGIDYFMDQQGIDSGEYWESVIKKNLDESDIFILFWSSAAKQSEEVYKEIKHALARKGDIRADKPPYFEPITIELPLPEPPAELKELQFSDDLLHIINSEEALRARQEAAPAAGPGAVQT